MERYSQTTQAQFRSKTRVEKPAESWKLKAENFSILGWKSRKLKGRKLHLKSQKLKAKALFFWLFYSFFVLLNKKERKNWNFGKYFIYLFWKHFSKSRKQKAEKSKVDRFWEKKAESWKPKINLQSRQPKAKVLFSRSVAKSWSYIIWLSNCGRKIIFLE